MVDIHEHVRQRSSIGDERCPNVVLSGLLVRVSAYPRLKQLGSYLLRVAPLVGTALGPVPAGHLEEWANGDTDARETSDRDPKPVRIVRSL
jgi:hypothetical protein